jgi:hypothetical protein
MNAASDPLSVLLEFIRLLRLSGLRVGLTETQDALQALTIVDQPDWSAAALKATLVKRKSDQALFDRVFNLYFGQALQLGSEAAEPNAQTDSRRAQEGPGRQGDRGQGGGGGGGASTSGADRRYQTAVNKAVQFLMRHVYDSTRQNQARSVQEALVLLSEMVKRQAESDQPLTQIQADIEQAWLATLETNEAMPALESLLGVGDLDEVSFAQMDHSEGVLIEQQIERLIEQLLAKPKRRMKRQHQGRIDLRRTVRASLQYGGTPVKLNFKKRQIEQPQLYVLADISGSVEVFARFFLMLTRAFQSMVTGCRTFVFADQLHEVTAALQTEMDVVRPGQAVERLLRRLRATGWTTRRTDYGTTLKQFHAEVERNLNRRTTIVVLGDARNNQAPSQAQALKTMFEQVDKIIWLNPERETMWNTGDSIQGIYSPYCDQVLACRNLAQLRHVISVLSRH